MPSVSTVDSYIDDINLARVDIDGAIINIQQEAVRVIRNAQDDIQTARAILAACRTAINAGQEQMAATYELRTLRPRAAAQRKRVA